MIRTWYAKSVMVASQFPNDGPSAAVNSPYTVPQQMRTINAGVARRNSVMLDNVQYRKMPTFLV